MLTEDFTPETPIQRTFSEIDTADKCVTVETTDDSIFEEDETFTVTLSVDSPSEGVTVTEGMSQTTVTITDDDGKFINNIISL